MRGKLTGCLVLLLISIAACSSSNDGDGIIDTDADLFSDETDNCPLNYNPDQMASIGNATLLGDVCDDEDEDAIVDAADNCPLTSNNDQSDTDGNGVGDACESCQPVSLAADIWTGAGSGSPSSLTELNGRLYFRANDGINGDELWQYDQASGANLVAEIVPGSGGSSIDSMWARNGKLLFTANDGVYGREVWTYDPADPAAGAYRVTQEFVPGSGVELNGKGYFFRDKELWAYDLDNPSSTASLVFDIDYGFTWATVFTAMDGKLYFKAGDGSRSGLWAYDPANPLAGALLVAAINVTSYGQSTDRLVLVGKLYFFGFRESCCGPPALWVYDPAAGASAIIDNAGSYPVEMTELGGKIYIARDEFDELWVYDPADPAAGTTLVARVGDGQNDDVGSEELTALNGKLYFVGEDGVYGKELWVYDPATATAGVPVVADVVVDLVPGIGSSSPRDLTIMNNKLYFRANDGVNGHELWVVDPGCLLDEV